MSGLPTLTDEIAHLLDISQDNVAFLHDRLEDKDNSVSWDSTDAADCRDAELLLLRSIAGSLSAIAHLMARQDDTVWDKVKSWSGGMPDE